MNRPKRILVVDDERDQVQFLEEYFTEIGHAVETAHDGFEALAKVRLGPDLVLLDVKMPGMDGYEVARRIREEEGNLDIPIVMVTVLASKEDRLRAVEAGATDFISKPIDMTELKVRTASLLKMKEARDQVKRHRLDLEEKVRERTETLRGALEEVSHAQRSTFDAHLETIRRLAVVAEYKDKDTAAHIQRVREYCSLLAQGLNLPPGEIEMICHAAPMHDVGKIIVPESILLKPGKLTPEEWEVMREHTSVGSNILAGSSSPLLKTGEVIALSHHEKWDGSGYPNGVSEGDIPIAGRICALADVFDALTSERPYKRAFSVKETSEILMEGRGKHFDPRVAEVFFKHRHAFRDIQEKYGAEGAG